MKFRYPLEEIIQPYLLKYKEIKGFFTGDNKAFDFFHHHSKNNDTQDVLLKIVTTRDPEFSRAERDFTMASHIVSLGIDTKLSEADPRIVNYIAQLPVRGQKQYFYTFACKYCNFHDPESYPIYNDDLESMLIWYFRITRNVDLQRQDFRDYSRFRDIMTDFRENFPLPDFNYKDLDKFLWIYGKDVIIKYQKLNHMSEDLKSGHDLIKAF